MEGGEAVEVAGVEGFQARLGLCVQGGEVGELQVGEGDGDALGRRGGWIWCG